MQRIYAINSHLVQLQKCTEYKSVVYVHQFEYLQIHVKLHNLC